MIKAFLCCIGICLSGVVVTTAHANTLPIQGFGIEDGMNEVTLKYSTYGELIVLPVLLNDSVRLNLILDTGCRSIVLFGKKFFKYVNSVTGNPISFSGLGDNIPLTGRISLNNSIKMNGIRGNKIAVVVLPNRHVLGLGGIDGVIGYDLLMRFEIEVNPRASTITFRPADRELTHTDFVHFKLRSNEIIPVSTGRVMAGKHTQDNLPLLIDTGSQLGILMKAKKVHSFDECKIMARGFCGYIKGVEAFAETFQIQGQEVTSDLTISITPTKGEEMLSIGMDFLKDYIFIINSAKEFFALKPATQNAELLSSYLGDASY